MCKFCWHGCKIGSMAARLPCSNSRHRRLSFRRLSRSPERHGACKMQIDFSQEILDLDGEVMKQPAALGAEGKPITLASIAAGALLAQFQDEQNLSGQDKVKRFKLAEQVYAGGLQQ